MGFIDDDKVYQGQYSSKATAALALAQKKFPGEPSMVSDYYKQIMDDMTFREIELELGIKRKKKGGIVTKKRGGMVKKFSSGGAATRGFGKVIK